MPCAQQWACVAEISFKGTGCAVHDEIAHAVHAELRGTAGAHVEGTGSALDIERYSTEILCW